MSTNHRPLSDSAEIYVSSIDGAKCVSLTHEKFPAMGSHERWLYSQAIVILLKKPFDMCNCCSCYLCTCSFFIDTTIDQNEEMAFLEGKYSKELIINSRLP